jgi:tetratricopeptide (TPR) repeat protein
MSQVPPIVPLSSAIYNVIADQHARHGEWLAAITNYTHSVLADPTNHLAYHLLSPLLVETGNLAGYAQHRQQILLHFGSTTDPTSAERMARDCLLLPPSASELPLISKMVDTALTAVPGTAWITFVKGFAEYRQEHFESAVEWLTKASAQATDPALKLQAQMVLAMTQFKLNQPEAARATLARGVEFAAAEAPQRDGLNWNDRRSGYLLMQEAKTLIQSTSSSAATGNK